jgi:hypothetical protein
MRFYTVETISEDAVIIAEAVGSMDGEGDHSRRRAGSSPALRRDRIPSSS